MNKQWNGGLPDPDFGENGQVLNRTEGMASASSFVLPDQKLLMVSTIGGKEAILVRYRPNGALDTDFGVGGDVRTSLGMDDDLTFTRTSQTVSSDGKVLLGGHFSVSEQTHLCYVRLTPEGQLDNSFGTGGRVIINLPNTPTDETTSVAFQSDGKVVALAESIWGFDKIDTVLFRLLADGRIDETFGSRGYSYEFPAKARLWGLLALPDGKLLMHGSNYPISGILSRFDANGHPDETFGEDRNGHCYIKASVDSTFDQIYGAAVQPDGKVVVVGCTGSAPQVGLIARVDVDGTLDKTFNDGNPLLLPWGPAGNCEMSVVVLEDGNILSLGQTFGTRTVATLRRFFADGEPDASFGQGGIAVTNPNEGIHHMMSRLEVQLDGKYVISGGFAGERASAIFRFLSS